MSNKSTALRTFLLNKKIILPGEIVTDLPRDQFTKLKEAGVIEEVKTKRTRKKKLEIKNQVKEVVPDIQTTESLEVSEEGTTFLE